MLTCGVWVKRGIAKEVPDKVELNQEDLKQLLDNTRERIEDLDEENDFDLDAEKEKILAQPSVVPENIDKNDIGSDDEEISALYDLDNYDEGGVVMTGAGMKGLMFYASNNEDPYVTIKDNEDDEKEDFLIKSTDNLFVIGKMEEDYSCLDVYVYNEDEDSCYVHHDILLDSFPLCLEWLSFDPSASNKAGNYVAVGSMEPDIQVWDLDIVDTMEPAFVLQGYKKKKKKKTGSSEKSTKNSGHSDAVLSLSWNHNARNVLASGSADKSIILWDMSQCTCVHSLKHHVDKVQSVAWHPQEAQTLLSGAFDKTAIIVDGRDPDNKKCWNISGECEQVKWDIHSPYNFFVSCDNGILSYFDVRQDKPVFTLNAHNEAVTGITLSGQYPGCLATVSSDKMFKIWDYRNNQPSCVCSRDMKMGGLNFVSASPDSSLTFAMGGGKEGLRVFNFLDTAQGSQHQFSTKNKSFNDTTTQNNSELKNEAMEEEMSASLTAMNTLQIDNAKPNKDIIKRKKKKK